MCDTIFEMSEFEPTADFRQREGVELSSLGYYDHAEGALKDALNIAGATYGSAARVQAATIHRDIALNALRQGDLNMAGSHLYLSERQLERMRGLISDEHRRAELGATVTARARLATAGGERAYARLMYRRAHELLVIGDNGYYLTSNDILAAREARIAKRRVAALGWAALAAKDVVVTAILDRPNAKAAARTFIGRLPDTLTRGRATASLVRTTPVHGRISNV